MAHPLTLSGAWLAAVWLSQAGAAEPAPGGLAALEPACDEIIHALGPRRSLAVPAFLLEGGQRQTTDLERFLLNALGRRAELRLVPPAEVAAAGPVAPGPAGLAALGARHGVDAGLGATLIQSPGGDELQLLLVDAQGQTLLDRAFPLGKLPPPSADLEAEGRQLEERLRAARDALHTAAPPEDRPAEPAPPEPAPPEAVATEAGAPGLPPPAPPPPEPAQADLQVAFQLRRLEVREEGGGWIVVQGADKRLSDLSLCMLGGRPDLVTRVTEELSRVTLRRDLGVGLTLAGVVLAGLTLPFLKAEDDGVFNAGIGTVATGLATATAGAVLWGLYGPEADALEHGAPDRHLIERRDAEQMVRAQNDALRRELGLPTVISGHVGLRLTPLPGGASAGIGLAF